MRHETLDRPNLASRKKIRRAFSSKSHSRPSLVVRTDGKRHHRSRFPVSVKRYATTILLCSSLLRRLCEHSILETRTKLMNFLSCDFHRNAPSRGIPLDATRSEPFKFSVFFSIFLSFLSSFFFLFSLFLFLPSPNILLDTFRSCNRSFQKAAVSFLPVLVPSSLFVPFHLTEYRTSSRFVLRLFRTTRRETTKNERLWIRQQGTRQQREGTTEARRKQK